MFCGLFPLIQFASAQSGTVAYNETLKLEIHLEGMGTDVADRLPKERISAHLLYYTPEASLYENSKQADDREVAEEMAGGGTMMIKMQEPDEKLYYDIKNQRVTEQRDFMSRLFLIDSPSDTIAWKLTGNRREILGYPCLEAILMNDTVKTIAWFTPSIPVSAGPAIFHGLPGLILEVNVNNGKRIITASSVAPGEVTERIVKPGKGKKVTREEFNRIVEEKTGKAGGEGGATFMIRISQD